MKMNIYNMLYKLIYNSSIDEMISFIKNNTDSIVLHHIAYNYNWNNGFDIPKTIIESKYCDLGTALMIFENAEGFLMFLEQDWKEVYGENIDFLLSLRQRIEKRDFKYSNIKFKPFLTRTDIFNLKKSCPNINKIFIEGNEGKEINIIVV